MNRFVGWEMDVLLLGDDALVGLARDGDDLAFEELVRRHSDRVYAQALGMLHDPVEAQDAVQDTFLNAYRKLAGFRGDAAFSSWLYRICANACLMRMRTRRRRPEVPLALLAGDDEWERPVEDPAPGAHSRLEIEELGVQISDGVAQLPEVYREVFERADVRHMTMREIADDLDLSVPNVKTRLHRARVRLRKLLGPYLEARPVPA